MPRRDDGPHLAPVFRREAFALWWWVCTVLGTATVVVLAGRLDLAGLGQLGLGPWLVLGLILLSEVRPVIASNRTDPDGINLATAFVYAAMLRWGLDVAVVAVTLATLLGEIVRGKRAYAALLNVAQYTLSYSAAWGVLLLGGWQASAGAPAQMRPADLPLVVLAGAAYHLVNLAIVGTAIALAERRRWWISVTAGFRWYTLTTGAVLALAPLVVVILEVHAGFLPLLGVPLALLWSTAGLALDRERSALTDPLTGLANRTKLAELVDRGLWHLEARAAGFAVCLVDLDRFKEVNDTFGHGTGDTLLRAVGSRLAGAVRDGDHVARLGGDEFVLLLDIVDGSDGSDGSDGTDVRDILDRVVVAVEAPFEVAGVRLEVEMSIGVAMAPEDGDDLEVLLRRADLAMYAAKSAGEAVRLYRPELERQAPSRMALLADLRRALERDELELHFQPQVSVPDARVTGVEALVRWRHPDHGLLLPHEFLPLAERTATMRLVTTSVLRAALRQQVVWRGLGLHVPVAINVSLHDLADGGFAAQVAHGLSEHGVPASALRIEITEDALVGDAERVLATLHALRDAGVGLSLDDFGTGQSSLTRLKRIPVAEVKIDGDLVVDLDTGSTEAVAIVRSVLDLTRALGVRSIAEGVETAGHWDALVALGADAAQGWLFAPALPTDEATAWLLRHLDAPVPVVRNAGARDGSSDGMATASG